MFIINPQVVFVINNQSYFNRTIASSIEKEKQERQAPGHTQKTSLEISTVLSLKVLFIPHFSELKPETMPKDWPHVE